MMDIGAIGWWGYDNAGDLAMLGALRRGLAPHRVVPIDTGFPAHPDAIYRLNRLDYVILGGGTLIPGRPTVPFDTFDQWGDHLRCPLGAVGLGVDPFPERYWSAIETLINRAEYFYVRDEASRSALRNHPKVQVMPDLTFANPLPETFRPDVTTGAPPVCGVNLRRTSSFDPEPWLDSFSRLPVRLRGIPLSSFGGFNESVLLRQLDPDSPERFEPALYDELDLMIGTAFHSVLFAVQAGVPIIAINSAPKVRNFMADNGLERYLLGPDERQRLPQLVSEVLAERAAIAGELRGMRAELHHAASQVMNNIRMGIEGTGSGRRPEGPPVTIFVLASGDGEKDQRTVDSCVRQSYANVKVTLIEDGPLAQRNAWLKEAALKCEAEYLTWVDGGDWYADDALSCLISRLEREPHLDAVYADYHVIDADGLRLAHEVVLGPEKLYRRDVVGPCFLMRRTLLPLLNGLPPDASLLAYSLWLRLGRSRKLIPFHAPLLYSERAAHSHAYALAERQVRRQWRQSGPRWKRLIWGIIDTELGERTVVQPIARLLRLVRARAHA